jgi:hypothetical protein
VSKRSRVASSMLELSQVDSKKAITILISNGLRRLNLNILFSDTPYLSTRHSEFSDAVPQLQGNITLKCMLNY